MVYSDMKAKEEAVCQKFLHIIYFSITSAVMQKEAESLNVPNSK